MKSSSLTLALSVDEADDMVDQGMMVSLLSYLPPSLIIFIYRLAEMIK